jgi:hypothetical protein
MASTVASLQRRLDASGRRFPAPGVGTGDRRGAGVAMIGRKTLSLAHDQIHWYAHAPDHGHVSYVGVYMAFCRNDAGDVWITHTSEPVDVYLRGTAGKSRKLEVKPNGLAP